MGLSEADKAIAAVLLALGLCFVFIKVLYEYYKGERFTLFNILHPVQKITDRERHFIASFLKQYQHFDASGKRTFLKRFSWLKSKKKFVFYGNISNEEEIKAYVVSSAVLLTMGMKTFQYQNSVRRVIVYPSQYYSKINKQHHLGEYNPRLKILVFAADALKQGFDIPNDGINLGIHELSHALCYEMQPNGKWENKRFHVGLRKLREFLKDKQMVEKLGKEAFFRDYAYRNVFEFFAILTECYVESPIKFLDLYPKLYRTLQIMYNFDFAHKHTERRL